MNYKEALNKLEELNSIATIGEPPEGRLLTRGQFYGIGDHSIGFIGVEPSNKLFETIEFFWLGDKEIHQTVSKQAIEKQLIKIIREVQFSGAQLSEDTVRGLFGTFKAQPIERHETFYDLYGAEYFDSNPLEIGPYKIYNRKIHKENILSEYPHAEHALTSHEMFELNSEIFVSTFVYARDQERAKELAYSKFKQFDDVIKYMMGNIDTHYDMGIFNFNGIKNSKSMIFSKEHAITTSKTIGALRQVDLQQFPINDPKYGHDKIWKMLNKSSKTELEKRILAAIGWVGKGLRDNESSRSFTQFIFALEALFQHQQKNTFVSPSISNQISEFAAFIIGENYDSRVDIESRVKNLYGKRSKIVHGGSDEINEYDRYEALHLVKHLIQLLLVNEELAQLKTIHELNEWVRKQRYTVGNVVTS